MKPTPQLINAMRAYYLTPPYNRNERKETTMAKRQAFDLNKYRYVIRNNNLIVLEKDQPEIWGKNVVFTGELSEWTRERAEARARLLGAYVQSNVTKSTDYVIIGLNPGTKLKQAVQNGAEIITDEQWNDMAKA